MFFMQCKHVFKNVFKYTENEIGSHENTPNIHLLYETRQNAKLHFSNLHFYLKIHIFKKYKWLQETTGNKRKRGG